MRNEILSKGMRCSKNFEIDELIDEPIDILKLSNKGKAIYVKNFRRLSPASFVLSMQFRQVITWMNNNNFYTVKKVKNE